MQGWIKSEGTCVLTLNAERDIRILDVSSYNNLILNLYHQSLAKELNKVLYCKADDSSTTITAMTRSEVMNGDECCKGKVFGGETVYILC
ncbi:unnamed protein product [Somion occarium]|uniref:Uncharacterized protein n=1 Tax=Somion occarium TaxID=3059160 RepID=A0ABP1CKE4_9APHY